MLTVTMREVQNWFWTAYTALQTYVGTNISGPLLNAFSHIRSLYLHKQEMLLHFGWKMSLGNSTWKDTIKNGSLKTILTKLKMGLCGVGKNLGTHSVRGWVGTRAGLEIFE